MSGLQPPHPCQLMAMGPSPAILVDGRGWSWSMGVDACEECIAQGPPQTHKGEQARNEGEDGR